MKKGILLLVIGLLGITVLLGIKNIYYHEDKQTPDSGWDYDYDSGSSWSSSSSSDWSSSSSSSDWSSSSSSSYDRDYDYGYSSSSTSSNKKYEKCEGNWWSDCGGKYAVLVFSFVFGLPIAIFIISIIREKKERRKQNMEFDLMRLGDLFRSDDKAYDELRKAGFDPDVILLNAYSVYVNVQMAWSNFDYDTLRRLLSDELYNNYKIQLEALSLKNQQNIMSDIEKTKLALYGVNVDKNGNYTIYVRLGVSQKDYVVDMNNPKHPIRGDLKKHDVYYELKFALSKVEDTICPNCGAKLVTTVSSQNCPYCNSVVISKSNSLILTKKINLAQNILNRYR